MTSKPPAVACGTCQRSWNSASMADGLRLLGACPRCGGSLEFADDAASQAGPATPAGSDAGLAPHLVLGLPQRH